MKRVTCDFKLLDFDDGTFLASSPFTPALLSIQARSFGAQAGEGENIQFIPIPEATLFFRGVTFCERVVRALDERTGLFRDPVREREDLPGKEGDANPEFTFFGDSDQPSGRVQWIVRAGAFEMELGDDILGQLSEAGFVFHFS